MFTVFSIKWWIQGKINLYKDVDRKPSFICSHNPESRNSLTWQLFYLGDRQWSDKVTNPLEQSRDVFVPEWPPQGRIVILPALPMEDMWVDPPPPPPPRELLCSDFIPVPHLIKHRIHESDSNSGKEKNIFRIILEKGDMSEPLLEPRYQNTRKEERDRERERMWIFFHLPFCETICNSLLTNQFERKLRWWAFGCHGNYSAVCSHLMHL